MARMVPFPMLPTDSAAERRLYEGFLEQLDESYVVYHSVDWVLAGPAGPIEGEADFVIAHPENGVLALEAKGGAIAYDPKTRAWTQSGRSGSHRLDEDPFHQAKDEIRSLIEILAAQPGFERWKPSYGYGVAFPDGRYTNDAHPGAPAAAVIDHDDMDSLAARVEEIQRFWHHDGRRFGADGMEALAQALGFRFEVRVPLRLAFDEGDRKIVELTRDQAWIRAYVLHRRRAGVSGPAGSGKTMLALGIAHHLAAAGQPTLLACLSRRLAAHLRDCSTETPSLDVMSFHELCVRTATEAGLSVPDVPAPVDERRRYFDRTLPDLLGEAARSLGARYDAMVVDEAQEFRDWWWPVLLALHRDPNEGRLYVFSDDNRRLSSGMSPVAPGDVSPPLRGNLRTTRAIHDFVSVFYRGESRAEGNRPPGRPPEILGYRDADELVHLLGVVLTNLIREEQVPPEDVVVLTPGGKDGSALRRMRDVDGFRLSEEVEPGTVLVSSVEAFNGLERPVVILAGIEPGSREDLARSLYLGGTRARNHLIVLATETIARELRELAGIPRR